MRAPPREPGPAEIDQQPHDVDEIAAAPVTGGADEFREYDHAAGGPADRDPPQPPDFPQPFGAGVCGAGSRII